MRVYYNYEHFFALVSQTTLTRLLEAPSYGLRMKKSYLPSTMKRIVTKRPFFLGRHRTFQIGTSYVCIELPQKNMNGSKGTLYLGHYTL